MSGGFWACLWASIRRLKAEGGLSLLVIDKSIKELKPVADRAVLLERGATVWTGPAASLTTQIADRYLGV